MKHKRAVVCLIATLAAWGADDPFEIGRKLQEEARYPEAEKYYRLALKENPRSIPALTNLGVVLAREGRYPDAIAVYKSALKIDASVVAVKLNLAIAYVQTGNCAEAAHWLEPVVRSAPTDRRSRQLLGICQLELSQFPEAVQSFEALLPSDDASVLLGASTAFLKVGRTSEATALLERIIKEVGNSPAVDVIVGMAQFGNNDFSAAAATLQSALSRDPSNAEGRFYLGAAFFKQNDLDGAIREWRQVAGEKPTHFPAVFALGALLGERQEYGEARVLLNKAAGMRPDNADVQLELGKIAFKQEEFQTALRHLQVAVKLNPKSKTISFFLARSLQRLGRKDEAHAEFERRGTLPDDTPEDLLGNAVQGATAPGGIVKPR